MSALDMCLSDIVDSYNIERCKIVLKAVCRYGEKCRNVFRLYKNLS